MKIRRYTCKDMQEALLKVKMDLGSEAVIMNSRKVKPKGLMGLFSKPMIEVVAAIDDDYVKPQKPAAFQSRAAAINPFQQAAYQQTMTQTSRVRENAQPFVQEQPRSVTYPNPAPEPVRQAPDAYAQQAAPSVNTASPATHAAGQVTHASTQAAPATAQDNQKIIDLENKVKNMESMLEQIYKAVQSKDEAEPEPKEQDQSQAPDGEGLTMLRDVLFDHDVEPKLIEKIVDKIRERGGNSLKTEDVFALAGRVMTVLLGEPEPLTLKEDGKPKVVILVGPTGVGKTTTLAKIAADFTLNKQKKVGLITADTYRIAAVEQLKTYAEILNIPVTVVYSPREIQGALERLSDKDLILVDTAGRSHKNKSHFDELKMLISAVNADETYLVMSANSGKNSIREILEYYAFMKQYKLLFTKLDESPVPGIMLNARYMTGKPLSYTTAGQSVPDDLEIANVKQLVASLLSARPNI
ncbi:MAG: flagellar biosynthesis protein FlhF [Clostridia bacterium]|nr:flagellar biosynthesis protein FlhF [Clostridia bacterium]